MRESLVFVVEKPSVLRMLAPHLSAKWSNTSLFAIATMYVGLYEFRYPRGLCLADIPYVNDPCWKPRPLDAHPAWSIQAGKCTKVQDEPASLLHSAGEIWFAACPDASGAVAFDILLTQCMGAAGAALVRPALRLASLDDVSMQAALEASTRTSDDWFVECRNAGHARRYFDFNFNVNSLVLFSDALRRVGAPASAYALSKYSLQLLYSLRERPAFSDGTLISLMQGWKGTGRYAPAPLGSPASRATIVEGLLHAGLIERTSSRHIVVPARGLKLLQLLHPDCQDADLPARIRQWEATWPASRTNIQRYLRTFFGKQRRFAAHEESKAPA